LFQFGSRRAEATVDRFEHLNGIGIVTVGGDLSAETSMIPPSAASTSWRFSRSYQLRVHDVWNGRLMRGNSGQRRYDTLGICHDVSRDSTQYISSIETFVEGVGDFVLTGTGLDLPPKLDVGEAANIDVDDFRWRTILRPSLATR
jgi:hypothetical protein